MTIIEEAKKCMYGRFNEPCIDVASHTGIIVFCFDVARHSFVVSAMQGGD
jgi:hypothetical protein